MKMATELALKKISEAEVLLSRIDDLDKMGVKGSTKLRKRIKSEINFLNKGLKKGSELKEEHVLCSNLGQLGALYEVASQAPQVVGVLRNFSSDLLEKIVVDVVAESGKQWIKVILRCPKALHLLYIMGGRKGVKPLDEVAEEFLIMADQHPVFYSVPKVVFWFFSGVSEGLACSLEELGVLVKGKRIPDGDLGIPDFTVEDSESEFSDSIIESEDENLADENIYKRVKEIDKISSDEDCDVTLQNATSKSETLLHFNNVESFNQCVPLAISNNNESQIQKEMAGATTQGPSSGNDLHCVAIGRETIKKINLDVTALIAYVSSTTNGGAHFIFADKALTEQAEWERKNAVKIALDKYFQGCELLVCQEALDHFLEIINTIGGPQEKKRTQEFVSRLTVVPGEDVFKDKIKIGGKVRKLSRIIFGTSQAYKAITVTSNRGFVRSAEQQGIKPVVLYHEARALTEMKEGTATILEDE
ncbi:hypothetical protein SK128_013441 [Halocaridina rubra]|uniref:DUF1308 domain-containing protein n=1 Tax=Halocaridina rubra TaxID=373956 RepID=A0AAN8WQ22_HALRR